MTSTLGKVVPCLLTAALALAACAPAPTATPDLPTPAVSTGAPTEVMPEATAAMPEDTEEMPDATEVMPEATEAMPEATEAMPDESGAMITGAFVKEEQEATGSYSLDPATGKMVFSDDFGVVPGPDLFVVLSGASDLTVDFQTFGQMVVSSPMLTLGMLAKTNGAQMYTVPAGTDLSQYNSIVIWCNSFSVAFAAAPLAQ